jgi:hypothetical protein
MQQVKINAQAVKWVRHLRGTHYSNHPQLLVEGWHLGEDKYQRHRPVRSDVATRAGLCSCSDAGDPEASASNDDAGCRGTRHRSSWRSSSRRLRALEEDLNSLAALVARRPGVLEDGDTLLSAIDFADLPGEDEGLHL